MPSRCCVRWHRFDVERRRSHWPRRLSAGELHSFAARHGRISGHAAITDRRRWPRASARRIRRCKTCQMARSALAGWSHGPVIGGMSVEWIKKQTAQFRTDQEGGNTMTSYHQFPMVSGPQKSMRHRNWIFVMRIAQLLILSSLLVLSACGGTVPATFNQCPSGYVQEPSGFENWAHRANYHGHGIQIVDAFGTKNCISEDALAAYNAAH